MAGVDSNNYDFWNRKRKLITLQMVLIDDVAPLTVDRKVWTREWQFSEWQSKIRLSLVSI